MIIVSQDKEIIVNFNNIESIDMVADLDGTGKVPYKIYYETASKREELGKYKTEERAKEILIEIAREFKRVLRTENRGTGQQRFYDVPKAYYMPKE